MALEEYKIGYLSKPELRTMLGLGRIQLDGFLKSRDVSTSTRWKILKLIAKT